MMQALLDLQDLDTEREQLEHRLASLPELAAAREARDRLMEWDRTAAGYRRRSEELTASESEYETAVAELDQHRDRLQQQLRQVIAPREAEALQHEIATLTERRSVLDDRALESLEELGALEVRMSEHAGAEQSLRETVEESERALEAAQSELSAQLGAVDSQRDQLRAGIESDLLVRYDRLHAQLGLAVVRLVGSDCVGCPFQLSPGELQTVRDAPADEPVDCPQCGRLIVK